MELAQLDAFIAAADCGSFSRAADMLNVAQPSLSNRIQSLEREVGQALFERMGRGVKLTDAGRSFLPYAQRVLRTLNDGLLVLEGTRDGTSGRLLIGTAPAVGTYVLPRLLKVFCDNHEGVDVLVRTGHSDEVLQMVLDDDVQVGFGRPINHPDVRTMVLYQDELVLVVSSQHRYAKSGAVKVDDLAEESLILFDRDSGYYGMILGLFRELGVVPQQQMQLDSIEATKKMVEANLGIALLPEVSVDREIRLGTLHKVHIESAEPVERDIAVMYRRSKPQSGPMSAFLDLLGEIYGIKLPPVVLIDLHCHTFPLSQCSALKPEELVDLARERGLHGICLTEHDALWPVEEIESLRRRTAFPVFSGVEVSTDGGHLLAFGVSLLGTSAASADRLTAEVRAAGGLVYSAHPARDAAMRGRIPEGLDSVEAINGSDSRLQNATATGLAAKYVLPGIGGSDAHTRDEVGRAATEFEAKISTCAELLSELRAGRYRAVYL